MPRTPAPERPRNSHLPRLRATTVLGLVRGGEAALAADGQVTAGATVLKANANKLRTLAGGRVLAGFAGSAADGIHLFEHFETKLESFHGNLRRSAVELAKEWRSDRVLRRLDAQLVAVDREHALLISGTGDVIENDDGVVAIGSGSAYALAACRALQRHSGLDVRETVRESLRIAVEICIYTGGEIRELSLSSGEGASGGAERSGR